MCTCSTPTFAEVAQDTVTALSSNEYVLVGEARDLVMEAKTDPGKAFNDTNK
jgi:hypothetical protein